MGLSVTYHYAMTLVRWICTCCHNGISNTFHSVGRQSSFLPLVGIAVSYIGRSEERCHHIDPHTQLVRFRL